MTLEEARNILGLNSKDLSDDTLKDKCVKMQFLIESWLDSFEKQVFQGKTLNELLGESA